MRRDNRRQVQMHGERNLHAYCAGRARRHAHDQEQFEQLSEYSRVDGERGTAEKIAAEDDLELVRQRGGIYAGAGQIDEPALVGSALPEPSRDYGHRL